MSSAGDRSKANSKLLLYQISLFAMEIGGYLPFDNKNTLHNVSAVHLRNPNLSTSRRYFDRCGGHHQYTGGVSTLEGYHDEYRGT